MLNGLNFIGNNIRSFRRSRNWILAQLASKIGIQEGPLGRIERGGNLPSATVIYNLAKVLDISTDAIFAADLSQAMAAAAETDTVHVIIEPDAAVPPKKLLYACRELIAATFLMPEIAVRTTVGNCASLLTPGPGILSCASNTGLAYPPKPLSTGLKSST